MANIARMPTGWLDSLNNVSIFDDFDSASLARYTVTKDAGITTPATSGLGGILGVNGDTTDNDEVYVSTQAVFKCGSGYALEAKALVQYAEANTNAANILFGFASSVGADLIVDGGGVRTSGSIIAIYKKDGETVWRCVTRWSTTTNVIDTASTTTAGGSAYSELAISIADGGPSGTSTVTFYVDRTQLKDSSGNPIVHYFVNSTAAAMSGVYGLKQGSTTAESSNLQKWMFSQSY